MWSSPSAPQRAFKFTKSAYLESTLSQGALKLGTAREWRLPDGYEAARSDPFEMGHRLNCPDSVGFIDEMSPEAEAKALLILIRAGVIVGPIDQMPKFKDIAFVLPKGQRTVHANGYIFSLCRNVSPAMAQRMAVEFEYDVCIEITNVAALFHAMSVAVGAPSGSWGAVKYLDFARDITDPDWAIVNPYIKDERYAWQQEIRFCWPCEFDRAVGPMLTVPDAKRLLRFVHPFEFGGLG